MVDVPAAAPVTRPVEPIVALPLLLLQVPLTVTSLKGVDNPRHTWPAPEMDAGSAFMVTAADMAQPVADMV